MLAHVGWKMSARNLPVHVVLQRGLLMLAEPVHVVRGKGPRDLQELVGHSQAAHARVEEHRPAAASNHLKRQAGVAPIPTERKKMTRMSASGLPGLSFSRPKKQIWLSLNWLASKFLRIYQVVCLFLVYKIVYSKIQKFSVLKKEWHFSVPSTWQPWSACD